MVPLGWSIVLVVTKILLIAAFVGIVLLGRSIRKLSRGIPSEWQEWRRTLRSLPRQDRWAISKAALLGRSAADGRLALLVVQHCEKSLARHRWSEEARMPRRLQALLALSSVVTALLAAEMFWALHLTRVSEDFGFPIGMVVLLVFLGVAVEMLIVAALMPYLSWADAQRMRRTLEANRRTASEPA